MDYRSDGVLFSATANGLDISGYVSEATITYDLQRRISECSLKLHEWPSGVDFWDVLSVSAGLVVNTPTGPNDPTNQGLLERFRGFVWDPGHDLWPMSSTMLGRGPLILADRQKVPSDEEMDAIKNPPVSVQYEAPGVDLSVNPDTNAAWCDSDMITWVLGKCGLTSRIGVIGGLPHILGSQAFDQFCWSRRESGLSFIEKLDSMGMGWRTYELPPCCCVDGSKTIYRTRMSMLPDVGNVRATFWEGRDLLAGSSLQRSPSMIRNVVRVEGWNPGDYPQVSVKVGVHPVPPPNVTNPLDTEYFSSSLIENTDPDPPTGVSTSEVADWLLEEKLHDWRQGTIETWRDDAIGAGQSVYVNSPRLGGRADTECNQAFWVQSVTIKVSPGKFRQTLKIYAPAYWTGPGSVLGNLSLGGRLS